MTASVELTGRRYLVVEDEYLVASDLLMVLENAGAIVFGPVPDVKRALEIASEPGFEIDAAILDINLQGDTVYPAAKVLLERGTPIIFVTGYDCATIPKEFSFAPCITKPYDEAEFIATVAALPKMRAAAVS